MNIQGERTTPGALNTIGWDDEGVPADEWLMVRDGVFVDYQTTREQVDAIREQTGVTRSHGCAHGDSWRTIPFQRMPNINLLPGAQDLSVDDLIGATDRGIFIEGRSSYSIDQQRYNFQFGGAVIREIRDGKLGGMVKDAAYQSRTHDDTTDPSLYDRIDYRLSTSTRLRFSPVTTGTVDLSARQYEYSGGRELIGESYSVSVGLIYKHFGNKEALFLEIVGSMTGTQLTVLPSRVLPFGLARASGCTR